MPHSLNKSIFKAYDIRGIVDDTLTESAVHDIGHALGSLAHAQGVTTLVLGRDGRLSGERLLNALALGVTKAGLNVIDIGMVPTPVVYFATQYLNTGSGVAVTGSHNPPQYNGLKMMVDGVTLHGEMITGLFDSITANKLHVAAQAGLITKQDVLPAYIDAIVGDVKLARPMTVAIDCGNGVGGVAAVALFKRLGCDVVDLFCDVDGNFPNHHPDPADPRNLIDLQNALKTSGAEIGLAFDGDADRLGVVTKNGDIIYPDRQMMLFAADILQQHSGATVIFDVKCSAHLAPTIRANGGAPLMWKTGHSLMKAKLREVGKAAAFAGEMSGHLYFNDRWDGFDDGLYAGARLLEILSRIPLSDNATAISQCLNSLPQGVSTPELNIAVGEGEGPAIVAAFLKNAVFDNGELQTVDGVRVDFHDGFGLVRASNTTPVLVLRFEANDQNGLERIQNDFKRVLLNVKSDLSLPF